MNRRFLLIIAVISLTLVLLLAKATLALEKPGSITVKNETNKILMMYIDGYYQTDVHPGYSETARATYGEHKVEVYYDDKSLSRDAKLSESHPNSTWYISQSQL
jgi:hypothetical protein